jgi:lysophospholipase L1-like esterase
MKKSPFIGCFLVFLLTATVLAESAPVKIMCLGDSITYGMKPLVTVDAYRSDLSRFLDLAGWRFELLNNGHPGADSIDIDQGITADLTQSNPDLVLSAIGTNDVTFGRTYEETVFYIKKTINTALSAGVKKFYLAAVQPRFNNQGQYSRQNNLAQFQRGLVADLRRQGLSVYLTDINDYFGRRVNFDNWASYYLEDGKHPNDAGYFLMAESWYESLMDTTAPGVISDLTAKGTGAGQVELSWTAASDNQSSNRVLRYLLKESNQPITESNWSQASDVSDIDEIYPAVGGSAEKLTLKNLVPNKLYYFALKSEDNSGNVSAISNVASIQAAEDITTPTVTEITFDGLTVKNGQIISSKPLIRAVIHDLPPLAGAAPKAVNPADLRILIDYQVVTDGNDASGHYDSWDPATEVMLYQVKNELTSGTHSFSIEAEDYNGNIMPVYTIENLQVYQGAALILGNVLNYPNPFNPQKETTKIAYTLSNKATLRLFIFDYGLHPVYYQDFSEGDSGGRVGYNEVIWNGRDLSGQLVPAGLYFGRLVASGRVLGKVKIAVLK